jgi:uncharacterized OB-fold protein
MHCKHCGAQIENDSKFCSVCGGKTEPIEQRVEMQQPLNQILSTSNITTNFEETKSEKFTNAFLIIALINFGFILFWNIIREISNKGDNDIYTKMEIIFKPIDILNLVSVTFLCLLFTKKKEHKTILLIIGILLLGWGIYANYFRV